MNDVEYAWWEARFDASLGEHVRGERGDLGGLGHNGAAGRERRGDLPGEKVERQVPRADAPGHAHGLAVRVVHGHVVHQVRLAAPMQDGRGEEAEVGHGAGNVHLAGQRYRFAVIAALGLRENVEVPLDQRGHAEKRLAPALTSKGDPPGQGLLSGDHRRVHVPGVAVGDARVYPARCGLGIVEPRAA